MSRSRHGGVIGLAREQIAEHDAPAQQQLPRNRLERLGRQSIGRRARRSPADARSEAAPSGRERTARGAT